MSGNGSFDRTNLTELARSLLTVAYERASLKHVIALAEATGNKLQSKPNTLMKFLRNPGRGLDNQDDLLRLVTLFTTNPTGAALVQPLERNSSPTPDMEIRNRFISDMLRPADLPNVRLHSRYLIYHSSFLEVDHYAIRFLRLHASAASNQLAFQDTKEDRGSIRAMEGPARFINYGIVQFFKGKPHFISTDPSTGVGGRLIIIDQWILDNGYAQPLIGRMSGMSNNCHSYVKDVLLHRWEGSEKDGLGQTGDFPKESLRANHRARFADLAKMRPKNDLPDKTLDSILDC